MFTACGALPHHAVRNARSIGELLTSTKVHNTYGHATPAAASTMASGTARRFISIRSPLRPSDIVDAFGDAALS